MSCASKTLNRGLAFLGGATLVRDAGSPLPGRSSTQTSDRETMSEVTGLRNKIIYKLSKAESKCSCQFRSWLIFNSEQRERVHASKNPCLF